MLAATSLQEWLDHGSDYAFIAVELGGAWLVGRVVRSWVMRANAAELHQQSLARLAVAEERTAIARGLHDVVAHSLSVIAVQADAAEAALAHDPSLANAPLNAIRASSREALEDMRQLVQVLRGDDSEDGERRPTRSVADLAELVAAARSDGLDLRAHLYPPSNLPAGLSMTAYWIAHEGLTNARRHAASAPVDLSITHNRGVMSVVVRSGPGESSHLELSTGHGLIGARERTHAVGGRFSAGRLSDGGFEVRAELPVPVVTDA